MIKQRNFLLKICVNWNVDSTVPEYELTDSIKNYSSISISCNKKMEPPPS